MRMNFMNFTNPLPPEIKVLVLNYIMACNNDDTDQANAYMSLIQKYNMEKRLNESDT